MGGNALDRHVVSIIRKKAEEGGEASDLRMGTQSGLFDAIPELVPEKGSAGRSSKDGQGESKQGLPESKWFDILKNRVEKRSHENAEKKRTKVKLARRRSTLSQARAQVEALRDEPADSSKNGASL